MSMPEQMPADEYPPRSNLDPAAVDAADTAPADQATPPRDDAEVCPVCGADDHNPSFEVLSHCWRCGHVAADDKPAWPPADLDDRRARSQMRRMGVAVDLLDRFVG